jgi:hypothetical protein
LVAVDALRRSRRRSTCSRMFIEVKLALMC